nr:MAG TPA: hypothetical protein [Caudoviricetes sp.]
MSTKVLCGKFGPSKLVRLPKRRADLLLTQDFV